ncbi:TonB-dependent receptor [Compostibacter hankyongensis]|uniref:TonB-dependent receptor n=1 Tax=Compostibacter hankyongensis TaxID=1007089 RepID=A0ABP8FVN0_9BACT
MPQTKTPDSISLQEAFKTAEHEYGVQFYFDAANVNIAQSVPLAAKGKSLDEFLYHLRREVNVEFKRIGKKIAVKSRPASAEKQPDKRMSGLVTDSTGAPLPGVTVTVKDKPSIGTTTDLNGKYILDVPEDAVLVFRMIGFDQQEFSVRGREVIDVKLKPASNSLDETVVVAFGTQKKEDVVGAVTTINPSELKVPASNLTTALAGRLAGVIAYQRSGEPGLDNADFFIRGVTTFGYKKDPLIMIDGIEVTTTDLARLQPDDIASFSIMKDATATALYGARGANGVILITTKEGVEGKVKISVRLENSMSSPTRNVELADPVTYMKLANEAVLTRDPLGILPYSQNKIDNTAKGLNPYIYPATDWRKALFKDYTMNQRANVNMTGGGKVARYYLSGTFYQDNGVLKVDKRNNFNSNIDLKTYSLRSNVNIELTKSTEVIVRLSGTFDDYTGPIDGGAAIYREVMHTNPTYFPAYYPPDKANLTTQHILFGNYDQGQYINPYADLVKGYKNYSQSKVLAQFEVKQDLSSLTEGLSVRGLANTTRSSYFDVNRSYKPFWYNIGGYDKFTDSYILAPLNEEGGSEYLDYSEGSKKVSSTVYLEAAANYNRTLHDRHNLSGMLVFIMQNNLTGNAGSLQTSLPSRNLGLSGRFTYAYDGRYYGEFNFGYNGSERFYKNHRFGFFPSMGVAWHLSKEKFWEPLNHVISNLKFRATYGLVGNDAIGTPEDRFFYLSQVSLNDADKSAIFGRDNTYSRPGVTVSRYANTDISWETAYKTNIGFDMGLFDKVNIEADFFDEYRTNILMTRSYIPTYIGLSAPVRANVGKAASRGIDASVDYSEYFGKNLWLKGRANFTYATSEFKVYEEPDYDQKWLSHVGYSLSQQWGYIAERLFVDDEEAANSPHQNFGEYGGGDIKYRDVDGDGQITTLDMVPIGYPTDPEIVYGFGLSAGYKQFDLSFFFQGLARESFWINTQKYNATSNPGSTIPFDQEGALLKVYADSHWSEDNPDVYALWPRLSSTVNGNDTERSTWFQRNGTFLRLKQVEIGYSLPPQAIKRIHVENLRIYMNATNLLTFSKFKLWDVEMGANGLGYPVQRVVNIGAQVSF